MTEGDDPKNLPVRMAGMNELERLGNTGDRLPATRIPVIYGGGARKNESSLRDIFYVLFRHKWKIVMTFLLLSAATVIYVASIPQQFESEARIFIRGERTGVTVDPTGEGNSFLKGSRDGSSVRSEIGIIQSQVLADLVVDKLGPAAVLGVGPKDVKPPQTWSQRMGVGGRMGRAVDSLEKGCHQMAKKLHLVDPNMTLAQAATQDIVKKVQALPTMSESYVLRVTYMNSSPTAAQKVLDALLDAYQQQHIMIHRIGVSPEFFQAKIDSLKKQLTEKENALEAERKRLNITSLEGQKTLLLNQFNTFDTALKENAMSITSLKAKISQFDTMLARRQKGGGTGKSSRREAARSNPIADTLRGKLLDLQFRESDLASRYTDANPSLIDVRRQKKEVERMLTGESSKMPGMDLIADAVDGPSQEIELQETLAKVELEAESAREGTLIKAINDVRKDLDILMGNEKSVKQHERDVDILENEYRQYLKSMQVADISSALDKDKISNVSILQRATLPAEPVKSQRKLLALLGFGIFLSLLGGIGWAFGVEFCDHSVKTSEEVEKKLGLPVLVALPYHKRHKPLMLEANQ